MHNGLASYYAGIRFRYNQFEKQANEFATSPFIHYFVAENDRVPEAIRELETTYGLPVD
jgi:hypothetical protein